MFCYDLMNQWDVDYMEKEGPAFIEFGADQMGEFRFGLTNGNIDYRITDRGGQASVEWTWEGMDEMDPCTPGAGPFWRAASCTA